MVDMLEHSLTTKVHNFYVPDLFCTKVQRQVSFQSVLFLIEQIHSFQPDVCSKPIPHMSLSPFYSVASILLWMGMFHLLCNHLYMASVVVPYCYLFLLSVLILWFSYYMYVSDIF